MKTKETIELENALYAQSNQKREYGCTEVTIGFKHQGLGNEIVDYISMDSKNVFRCYEIKVTLSDLKTDNKKSFYGQYNYLVVSEDLYQRHPVWDNYIPPYVGILVGTSLTVRRQAKQKQITDDTIQMLTSSLLRTLYYKMDQYRNIQDLEENKELKKQLQETIKQAELKEQALDYINWTYHDFEHYYRLNHQQANYKLEVDAKRQRNEYLRRQEGQFTWVNENGKHVCPVCSHEAYIDHNQKEILSDYCPYCGSDLRKIH